VTKCDVLKILNSTIQSLQTHSSFDRHRGRSFVDRKFCQYIFCNILIGIVAPSSRLIYIYIYIYIILQNSCLFCIICVCLHIVVFNNILCCVYVLFVLLTLCRQFLWIVHFWLPLSEWKEAKLIHLQKYANHTLSWLGISLQFKVAFCY
jgi:hypothetical protein